MLKQPSPAPHQTTRTEFTSLFGEAKLVLDETPKAILYLNFPLTLSVSNGLGGWDGPAACRRQDRGADELVAFWHWSLTRCAGSRSRWCLCPELEPLMERPAQACSYLQERARTP